MAYNPDTLRLIYADPKSYLAQREDPNSHIANRNLKEELFVTNLFHPEEVDERFILTVEPPEDEKASKICEFVAREYYDYMLEHNDELDPDFSNEVILTLAGSKNMRVEEVTEMLTKHKDYFDFCLASEDKIRINIEDVKEIKQLSKDLESTTSFCNVFYPSSYRNSVETLIDSVKTPIDTEKFNILEKYLSNQHWPLKLKRGTKTNNAGKIMSLYSQVTLTPFLNPGKSTQRGKLYVDSIGYFEGKYTFNFFRLVEKSLGDLDKVILGENGLFIEIGLLNNFMHNINIKSITSPEVTVYLFLIDRNGYKQMMKLSKTLMKQCCEEYSKFINGVMWNISTGHYSAFGRNMLEPLET